MKIIYELAVENTVGGSKATIISDSPNCDVAIRELLTAIKELKKST